MVVVAVVLLAIVPSAFGARTLVVSPTHIDSFAQDGRFIAWTARGPNEQGFFCDRPYVRNLATGRQRLLPTTDCAGSVVLARGRALWAVPPDCGNCQGAGLNTAALGDPHVVHLGTFDHFFGGDQLTGLAGDGRLLAFSWVRYVLADETCFEQPVPCVWDVKGGRPVRVVGRERHAVIGVAPPAVLAAGAGRLAIAPAKDRWRGGVRSGPRPAKDGPVNVVDPGTGALVMSVSPLGRVRRLALSDRALAVLLKRADGSRAIERYAIPSGTLLASTPVAENASFVTLDISYKWIVYRVGHKIRIVDARGSDHLLIEPVARPIDVSIEGRRVAWAENNGGRHRIRAVLAPG